MTPERSRQLGQGLMAFSIVQLLLFVLGAARRSYAALAVPVLLGVALVSALAFWVGYTMAVAKWDDDELEDEPAGSVPGVGSS
jgi:hypothetical protein